MGKMMTVVIGVIWVLLGMGLVGSWVSAGEDRGTGVWLTLESIDGRALYAEVLGFGEREVGVRTVQGKYHKIKYDQLSETTQAVLEQLDGSEDWLARRYPAAWQRRAVKKVREAQVKSLGGTMESEEAVLQALRWLKRTQSEEGSWGEGPQVACTGLALMCLSGRGSVDHELAIECPGGGARGQDRVEKPRAVPGEGEGRRAGEAGYERWVRVQRHETSGCLKWTLHVDRSGGAGLADLRFPREGCGAARSALHPARRAPRL